MKTMTATIMTLAFVFSGKSFAATATTSLSDGQLAKILIELNDGEVEAAKLAKDRSQDSAVKAFAQKMIDAHKDNEKETKEVAKNNKIDLQKSDISKGLDKEADNMEKTLKKQDKTGFDKLYVEQQVKMHQKTLDMLDNTLIPNAKNASLKTHFEQTREHVNEHLTEAKNLEAKYTGSGTTTK